MKIRILAVGLLSFFMIEIKGCPPIKSGCPFEHLAEKESLNRQRRLLHVYLYQKARKYFSDPGTNEYFSDCNIFVVALQFSFEGNEEFYYLHPTNKTVFTSGYSPFSGEHMYEADTDEEFKKHHIEFHKELKCGRPGELHNLTNRSRVARYGITDFLDTE